jgi:zinc transport system substrate-binding protein
MRRLGIIACLWALLGAAPATAGELKVVVTIKPLHALVAEVMSGAGSPRLLVAGSASSHTYALRPSEVLALNHADVFFRVSESVEPFTAKLVTSLPKQVEVVTLQEAPGLRLLALRAGTTFAPHKREAGDRPAHSHQASWTDRNIDGHLWLDPDNAGAMVDRIAQVLSRKDSGRSELYRSNARALKEKLRSLAAELGTALSPIAGRPYVVFHDAFQYFERRYGLSAVGAIALSPEIPPSAKRLYELRRQISALGAMCVFAEPQFDRRLVDNVVEGTGARIGTLDPEGGNLEPGPDLYFTLMRKLADDLRACLAAPV